MRNRRSCLRRLARSNGRTVRSGLLLLVLFAPVGAKAQAITDLVSRSSSGGLGNDASDTPAASADGRYVAFVGDGNNLVPGDDNGRQDVFVRDRQSNTTVRVSVSSAGVQADRDCENPSISSDGRFVAFDSTATNLIIADTNGVRDVFLHDRDSDEDGIFDEVGSIATVRASVDSAGAQRPRASLEPAVSEDGDFVAFQANRAQGTSDILVFGRASGTTTLVSVSAAGLAGSGDHADPSISSDGRHVAFESNSSNLTPGDTNNETDIFVVDRDLDEDGTFDEAGEIAIVRASLSSAGVEGNAGSRSAWISADGTQVAFDSIATNLVAGDADGKRDVFVRNLALGETHRVSLDATGAEGNAESTLPALSATGRMVVFQSAASNLVAADTNARRDVFLFDRDTDNDGVFDESGQTRITRESLDSAGLQANGDSGDVIRPVVTEDGFFAVFSSAATNLVDGDVNAKRDVFTRKLAFCGNASVTSGEVCDDGNFVEGDGCDSNCTLTACGNGVQSSGETCDDGNLVDGDGCDSNCTPTGCGNGITSTNEQCDDNNLADGDGCDSNCTFTACGNGVPTAGEICDDGDLVDGDGCDSNCTPTGCGNGITSSGEDCDDTNVIDGDGCDSNCTFTGCGNGIRTAGESCDSGEENGSDACCSASCGLVDFDSDLLCDRDDRADLSGAALEKISVKATSGDPTRPSGKVTWKGAVDAAGAPYFSAAALLGQGRVTGFRVDVFATADEPVNGDTPVYSLDFDPADCVFKGSLAATTKATCKRTLPPPAFTVQKLTLSGTGSLRMTGSASRADVLAPSTGPLRLVLSVGDAAMLDFEDALIDCELKGSSLPTLKCST